MQSDPIFTKAIIRNVPETLNQGITVGNLASTIDMNKAKADHAQYIELIKSLGIDSNLILISRSRCQSASEARLVPGQHFHGRHFHFHGRFLDDHESTDRIQKQRKKIHRGRAEIPLRRRRPEFPGVLLGGDSRRGEDAGFRGRKRDSLRIETLLCGDQQENEHGRFSKVPGNPEESGQGLHGDSGGDPVRHSPFEMHHDLFGERMAARAGEDHQKL